MEAAQGRDRRILLLWSLVGVTVAYMLFHFALQMRLPADGCRTALNHLSPQGIVCMDFLLEPPLDLHGGDLVAKIGDRTVAAWLTGGDRLPPGHPAPRFPTLSSAMGSG